MKVLTFLKILLQSTIVCHIIQQHTIVDWTRAYVPSVENNLVLTEPDAKIVLAKKVIEKNVLQNIEENKTYVANADAERLTTIL